MSAPRRGRGRGKVISGQESSHSPAPTPTPEPQSRPTPPPSERASSTPGPAKRRLGTSTLGAGSPDVKVDLGEDGGSAGADGGRRVGGLLGAKSDYSRAGSAAPSKLKFVPNMRRKQRVIHDDEDSDGDVKMEEEEQSFSSSRGRGRGRGRGEVEMTASGAFAQGPGGIPKGWGGGRPFGPAGAGVMNASRDGVQGSGARGQFKDAGVLDDPDDSDIEIEEPSEATPGAASSQGFRSWAKELADIGAEDEMAPLTLPKDPKVIRAAAERRAQRKEDRVKQEGKVKAEQADDGSSVLVDSKQGTPATEFSRAGTVDSKTVSLTEVDEDDRKNVKPDDTILGDDFNLPRGSREQLYMFQFPRQFPQLIDADHAPEQDEDGTAIKQEGEEVSSKPKGKTPPDWGRFGARANRAARWPVDQGQMGELCVHRSGKVSLRVNGDLHYEILPAAQPSFLQEIAIIDHDPSLEPLASFEQDKERPQGKPSGKMVMMGQTSKKFIVVPEASHLLERIAEQEKREKEKEIKAKLLRKQMKAEQH